ncbi:sodium-extruding oxaloacetate decarboxylase subunit alpha [Parahaliea mediterranea]|uniref:Sodium-extruding oxaloacetate decarboxylase subunit alpha n=1 Tax=Parahaliea mediterranea TaxID=651086 RepID=A0A939IJY1_9GAMM|nr:sodium-extruding oxaloacetate decarboxylase subunit alpha [Parahaliea mediterranea]MBN7796771.1 sodium-extruding oxaloacetate decarboxylase subunit alpha [Parahaliea mediterranea]
MEQSNRPLGITDVVLRDAHQSLFATRMRLDDMLPIAAELDAVGFWSLESWGGATFDACIRYLGEDPWERIRELKKAMPNTPQQMLFRGQNILGYRHYADDVVEKFVERAAHNGVDVFRVFDAMNDMRNIEVALKAVRQVGKHAQGTISYTLSPVHDIDGWVEQGKRIEDMGADSIAIKDMAGLLRPYTGYELVKRLKQSCDIPIHMQCHATTGLSTATILKCVEAGIDNVDTSISSMSMTYGHSPTESVVAMLQGTGRDTGLDIEKLESIAAYFRQVRKKYAKFEGSLRGVDSRILVAQVPGGMLTNMENQLREQGAADRLDEVLEEIPRVREDLGYIPLVTPTSQIVGTQAVLNVLTGERYKSISRETAGVLKGEYGATPAAVNVALQQRVLEGAEPITCRPADLLDPELDKLTEELRSLAREKSVALTDGEGEVDDVLTYALFPQVGLKFLENRGNPEAFEPVPGTEPETPAAPAPAAASAGGPEVYTVTVNGQSYVVEVAEGGEVSSVQGAAAAPAPVASAPAPTGGGEPLSSPLAGNIVRVNVAVGDRVSAGDVVLVLEAMKMETEVRAPRDGAVTEVSVKTGDAVKTGDTLVKLG